MHSEPDLRLVSCDSRYWEFVRQLRTDPGNLEGFVSQTAISVEAQRAYMQKYSACYRICLLAGQPVGFIGAIENDIRVCTANDFKNRGIASFMVREFMKEHPDAVARIKVSNEASKRLFERCGFEPKYIIYEIKHGNADHRY